MSAGFNGVVYTKQWVVELMLDMAGYTTDRNLSELTLCEPSCGTGAFLVEITRRLCISSRNHDCFSMGQLMSSVIAYDLDMDSVQESRKKIEAVLLSEGFSTNEAALLASSWVRHDDYLLAEIPECDLVIGNPPYLRAVEIPKELREKYCQAISTMTRGCDLFVGFIQHGLDSLKPTGSLLYICADRWLQNQYGKTLRGYIVDEGYFINELVRMYGVDAFESEVDAYPSIIKLSKEPTKMKYVDCSECFDASAVPLLKEWISCSSETVTHPSFSAAVMEPMFDSSVLPLSSPERVRTVRTLMSRFPSLEDSGVSLGIGIATGNDSVFIISDPDKVESSRLLPAFNMRDWRRGINVERWLVNPWEEDNTLVDLEKYPKLERYLLEHKASLEKRHVARKGDWYRTIDKPKWSLLGTPMLLFPDMASKADPVYSCGDKYPCHNCYWMTSDVWNIKALGGLLMSDIAESFVEAMCVKMRGKTLRFQAQYLRLIHVPNPCTLSEETVEMLVDAFEHRDRNEASLAAAIAYGLE